MVDGAGRASLARPMAGSLASHWGPRAAGEYGRPRALTGGLRGLALAQHRLWREGTWLSSGGSWDPHPRGLHQETSRACAHTRGPAGFHGDPPTPLAEPEGPLGVTWSSPSGGSRPLQAGLTQGRQPWVCSRARPPLPHSFPKALLAPRSPQDSVQTLGLHPRPHRLLSFISACYPSHVLLHLWTSAPAVSSAWKASPSPIRQRLCCNTPSSRKPSLTP